MKYASFNWILSLSRNLLKDKMNGCTMSRVVSMALAFLLTVALLPVHVTAAGAKEIEDHWAASAIETCYTYGIMSGDGDGNYRSNDAITRAEFAVMINRAFGYTSLKIPELTGYVDIPSGQWYASDMKIAIALGFISGYGNGIAAPEDKMTREQAAVIIYKILRLNPVSGMETKFTDIGSVSSWAKNAVLSMEVSGYMVGSNYQFMPKKDITRGEAAQLLVNVIGVLVDEDFDAQGNAYQNVTIHKSGIRRTNAIIKCDLYITEGIGDGYVWLENVQINGRLLVAGGWNAIYVRDVTVGKSIIVDKPIAAGKQTTLFHIIQSGNTSVIFESKTREVIISEDDIMIICENDGEMTVFNMIKSDNGNSSDGKMETNEGATIISKGRHYTGAGVRNSTSGVSSTTNLTHDPIYYMGASTHITKTYGDIKFTNAIAAGYKGRGRITYKSNNTTVATVNDNGQVTILKAGIAIITATKSADATYAQASTSYTLTVTRKPITITGFNITKEYDGTDTISDFGTLSFAGLVNGETANVSYSGHSATYAQISVGTDISVSLNGGSFGMASGTANASNYIIIQPTGITGDITLAMNNLTVLSMDITVAPDRTLTPLSGETSTTFTVDVSGFAQDSDANSVGILIDAVTGLSFSGYDTPGDALNGVKTFIITAHYDGTTEFRDVSNILRVTNLSGLQNRFIYSGETKTTDINIIDGQAADRPISITSNNITAFNSYANTEDGLTRHYKLTEDITLTTPSFGNSNWTTMGDDTIRSYFTGSFDGDGHTIANLVINETTGSSLGFFHTIGHGGVVKNLGLVSCSINCSDKGSYYGASAGGIAAVNFGMVQNCYTTGVISSNQNAGGVVGGNGGTVQNCYSTAVVSSFRNAGGVAGSNSNHIINCYATGRISGYFYVGGIAGSSWGIVQSSYATGNIVGYSDDNSDDSIGDITIGGVVGRNHSYSMVQNCYATGNITGYINTANSSVGGVIGCNDNSTVQNCYATGDIICYPNDLSLQNGYPSGIGGVVGANYRGTVQNCIALSSNVITPTRMVGRIIGCRCNDWPWEWKFINNYAWIDMTVKHDTAIDKTLTTGLNEVDGADLMPENYNAQEWWETATNWNNISPAYAWDFTDIWEWDETHNLPILKNVGGNQAPTAPTVFAPAMSSSSIWATATTATSGSALAVVLPNGESTGTFTIGDMVTVTATPEDGWVFVEWCDENGNMVSTDKDYSFVVTRNITLIAICIPEDENKNPSDMDIRTKDA